MLCAFCRKLFAVAVIWPVTLLWMGFAVRHKERLPRQGPAIVIANHNSHLDALMLVSFFPLRLVPSIRIAAAADYFFTNRATRFIAEVFGGLVAVERGKSVRDPLASMAGVLREGGILILFPEGTRGSPDAMGDIKPGLWHLARRCPEASIHPVYLHGPGRSLPRGSRVPVPLFVDVCIGEAFTPAGDRKAFPGQVKDIFTALRARTLAGLAPLDEE